jgi:hypothetical protein
VLMNGAAAGCFLIKARIEAGDGAL